MIKSIQQKNDKIYSAEDSDIDNSNCTSSSYYVRERARIRDEQSERYLFTQKLMTILGG